MSDHWKQKPARDERISVRLPDDPDARIEAYQKEPIVHEIVRARAREEDVPVEDLIYGSRSKLSARANHVGFSTLGEVSRAVDMIQQIESTYWMYD